jgi:phosphosulfolactate synthase
VCYRQGKLNEYLRLVDDCGMSCLEISDGTIAIDEDDKLAIVRRLSKRYKVLSEVGSKDESVVITPSRWVELIGRELEAGAWKVITEGRESGTVGIYRPSGDVKDGLLEEIRETFDADQLLFEAPIKRQQAWFIKQFGSNVNLGNIPPEEVISVETLRLGVRGDTLLTFH